MYIFSYTRFSSKLNRPNAYLEQAYKMHELSYTKQHSYHSYMKRFPGSPMKGGIPRNSCRLVAHLLALLSRSTKNYTVAIVPCGGTDIGLARSPVRTFVLSTVYDDTFRKRSLTLMYYRDVFTCVLCFLIK